MAAVGIIGAGTWGTALAVLLNNNGHDVTIWSAFDTEIQEMSRTRRHKNLPEVVTPSLNQVFKFEGDWPLNSPKPYLLQSIAEIVKSDKAEITKKDDGYLVSSKVTYPNNKNFNQEEIMFDKDANLKWIQIYNSDHAVQLKIVFNKCTYDSKMKKDYFKTPEALDSKTSTNGISEEDLPLYPVQVFDADFYPFGGIKKAC